MFNPKKSHKEKALSHSRLTALGADLENKGLDPCGVILNFISVIISSPIPLFYHIIPLCQGAI